MCGIACAVAHTEQGLPTAAHLVAMTAAQAHRGPDGTGHLLVPPAGPDAPARIGLGHCRLAVIDPTPCGDQPMTYAGRYAITFNGAIYNHIELREQLGQHGYQFSSASDTEVVLAAYDLWGPDCLAHFNGMWALALADQETQTVLVARDRFGIKPLFLYQGSNETLLASDVRALLAHPRVPTIPDEAQLARCLRAAHRCWEADTVFQGISRFPAAHYAVLRPGQPITTPVRYWRLQPNTVPERFDAARAQQYAQRYLELLADAVAIRMRADVPLGVALSGGLDSSSVLALASNYTANNQTPPGAALVTFSSVHRDPALAGYDESQWIARAAAACGALSQVVEPSPADVVRLHDQAVAAVGFPAGALGAGGMRTYEFAAGLGLRVVLDGQGADELLGGYRHHWVAAIQDQPFRQAVVQALKLARVTGEYRLGAAALVARVSRSITGGRGAPRLAGWLAGGRDRVALREQPQIYLDPLNTVLARDLTEDLTVLLHLADARAMHNSVEVRFPFLDVRLVEFLAGVPSCYKVHDGYSKYLARLAISGLLPDQTVWRRDKRGWVMPDQHWLRGPLRDWAAARLAGGSQPAEGDAQLDVRVLNLARWRVLFPPRAAAAD